MHSMEEEIADKVVDDLVAMGLVVPLKAYLKSQRTSDGWDCTDSPVGTEYTVYRGTERSLIHGQPGRTPKRRTFIWARGGLSNSSGVMPVELFHVME